MVQVRKLVLAIAAAAAFGPGAASALGLGEVTLKSALNQPLDAEIELLETRDLSSEEVIPSLAAAEDFSRAGVDRQYFLTDLKFTPVVRADGKSVIRITSSKPVREPYLNFLVEVLWPSGRLLREYTLLLDPPLYSPEVAANPAPQLPVAVPTNRSNRPAPQPSAPPARAPQQPSTASAPAAPANAGEYRTSRSDTLWEIAERNANGGSVHQTMLAIQDLNPDAFIGGNINQMKSGQVLRLPTAEQIRSRSQGQALTQVAEQNRAWRDARSPASGERQLDARRRESADATPTQRATPSDNLKLLSGQSGDSANGAESGANNGADNAQALADKLATTEESLDTTRRENQELNSRLSDLQSQLDKLQRLVQLKDDQLARLQADAAQAGQPETGEGAGEQANANSAAEGAGTENERTSGQGAAAPASPEATEPSPAEEPATDAGSATTETPATGEGEGVSGDQPAAESAPEAVSPPAEPEQPAVQAPAEPSAAETPKPASKPATPPPAAASEESSGFLDSNLLMLAGGGAAVVLLLALLLLSRRRSKEARATAAATSMTAGGAHDDDLPAGSFDGLVLDEDDRATEAPATAQGRDPLGEADIYIAYGRFNQAADLLQNAIEDEPDRQDLRLKLMEVYAELGDRDGFARQENELREIGGANGEIEQLRNRYPTMAVAAAAGLAGAGAYAGMSAYQQHQADDDAALDDLSLDDLSLEGVDESASPLADDEPPALSLDDDLDFDLSEFETETTEFTPTSERVSLDASGIDAEDSPAPVAPVSEAPLELNEFSLDLDDASEAPRVDATSDEFLLDLDETPADVEAERAEVSDLDLSSDFDLSLADEEPVRGEGDFAAQLERVSAELDALSEDIQQSPEQIEPAASEEPTPVQEPGTVDDFDDEEFDFLSGTDETTTKLDLARAYIEMGDSEGAQDILDEVMTEGSDSQQQEARELLAKLV